MKPAERIILKFGGPSAMARALDHRFPTTVQGWKQRGYIPGPQHRAVYMAARREGITLRAADFTDAFEDAA